MASTRGLAHFGKHSWHSAQVRVMKKQQAALKKYDAYIDRKKYIIFQKK
jgi:hypothetical protein